MPITYTVDADKKLVIARWSGSVTVDDMVQHFRTLLADPAALNARRSLADLRGASLAFKGGELQHVIESVVQPLLERRNWTTAIVVDNPQQFGVSRQYQVFAESYSTDAIFYDDDAALRWLDLLAPRPPNDEPA